MKTIDFSILFVTQIGPKSGIGYLERILEMSKYCTDFFVLLIADTKELGLIDVLREIPHAVYHKNVGFEKSQILKEKRFDLIICDSPIIDQSWVQEICRSHIPVISFENPLLGQHSEVFIDSMQIEPKKMTNFSEWQHTPITPLLEQYQQPHSCEKILIIGDKIDPNNSILKLLKSVSNLNYKISLKLSPLSDMKLEKLDNVEILPVSVDLNTAIKNNDLIISQDLTKIPHLLSSNRHLIALMENHEVRSYPKILELCTVLKTSSLSKKHILSAIEKAKLQSNNLPNHFVFIEFLNKIAQSIVGRPAQCPVCGSYEKQCMLSTEIYNLFTCLQCQSQYYYNIIPHKANHTSFHPDDFIPMNTDQRQQGYKEIFLIQKEESYQRIYTIKNIMPTPKGYETYSLLDIGAEYGIFVQEAMHNGFFAQGVELSLFSRRLADAHNVSLIESMKTIYECGTTYDIITIWKKLEFLDTPVEYLKNISKLIRVGGLLVFRIPQANFTEFNGRFQATKKGSERLSKNLGFELKKIKMYTDSDRNSFFELYCMKQ